MQTLQELHADQAISSDEHLTIPSESEQNKAMKTPLHLQDTKSTATNTRMIVSWDVYGAIILETLRWECLVCITMNMLKLNVSMKREKHWWDS